MADPQNMTEKKYTPKATNSISVPAGKELNVYTEIVR